MARERRLDTISLASPVLRPGGSILVDGHVARTGVLTYRYADGSVRREYVSREELFAADSMASLRIVPVTCEHPSVGMLDTTTARGFTVGATGENVRPDGDWLAASFGIFDEAAIGGVVSGARRELSCGYDCDVEVTPGVTEDGDHYDVVQRRRTYNHLAIVTEARAGAGAVPRLDSSDSRVGVLVTGTKDASGAPARPMQGSSQMDPTTNPAPNMTADQALASLNAQLVAMTARAEAAESTAASASARADQTEGARIETQRRLDAAEARIAAGASAVETAALAKERERADAAEHKISQFGATLEARVRERAGIESKAIAIVGIKRFDSMTDRQIQEVVVKHLDPRADLTATDGVIRGRFDSMIDAHQGTARDMARAASVLTVEQTETAKAPARVARADAWKQPLPSTLAQRAGT